MKYHCNDISLRVLGTIYRLLTLLILTVTFNTAHAYRTDHGLLPPGVSSCDAHPPVTLDLPSNALPIPNPFLGEYSHGHFHVEELDRGLFYATDSVYQMIFLVSREGIILVDAPPSIGVDPVNPANSINFLEVIYSIDETQGKPIRAMVYSHAHSDHIGAASQVVDAFPDVRIYAHIEVLRLLRRATGMVPSPLPGAGRNPPPLPNRVFKRFHRVRVGSQVLDLSYRGPAHEPGNIFIYAPRQRTLMLVDVVFPGFSPFDHLALAEDVPSYVRAYDQILEYNFDIFVGGHLNRLGSRVDIIESRRYIADVQANATTALMDPSLAAVFAATPNTLGAFSIFLNQVACRCANLTLDPVATPSGEDWLDRLGAADSNTLTHCWAMAEALRIDPSF